MHGLNLLDFAHLLKCTEVPAVYLYKGLEKKADLLDPSMVVWPVAYLLGFHKKHIVRRVRSFSLQQASRSVADMMFRIKWKLLLKDVEINPWRFSVPRKRFCVPCTHVLDDITEGIIGDMSATMYDFLRRLRVRQKGRSLNDPVAELGFKYLKDSQYAAVFTDKE